MKLEDGLAPMNFMFEREVTCHEVSLSLQFMLSSAKRKYGELLLYCERSDRPTQANRVCELLETIETLDKQLSHSTMLLSALDREEK